MSTVFSLNLNKVALIRNSRGTNYPKLEDYVERAVAGGVGSITVHPRPDERHIRYADLPNIKEILQNHDDVEFNIEGFPDSNFIRAVNEIEPNQITLVPDTSDQLTSDHGWDVNRHRVLLQEAIKSFTALDARVILFWDPVVAGLEMVQEVGAHGIELYTEPYVKAYNREDNSPFSQYGTVFDHARDMGMRINAGHDLNLDNLANFLARCPVHEVSIGHAFFVEAIDAGFNTILKQYQDICR